MDDPFDLELELRLAKDELDHLAPDAYQERITVRERILDLEARRGRATRPSREELTRELAQLELTRAELRRARLSSVNANGGLGMGGGIDPNFIADANKKIDATTGLPEVEERIRDIRRQLEV